MEADIIVEADVVSLDAASVRNILMDARPSGKQLTKGLRVSGLNLPTLALPVYSRPGEDGTFTGERDVESTRVLPEQLLLFYQSHLAETNRRYGLATPSQMLPQPNTPVDRATLAALLRPKFTFGRYAYYWYAASAEKVDNISSSDQATISIVEDLLQSAEIFPHMRKQLDAVIRGEHELLLGTRHPFIRRYVTPRGYDSWAELRSRLSRAIDERGKFYRAEEQLDREAQLRFYLSRVDRENLFTNYALEELVAIGDRHTARELFARVAKLKIYADDAYEGARNLVSDGKPNRAALPTSVKTLNDEVEQECKTEASRTAWYRKHELPFSQLMRGVAENTTSFSELRGSLSQLYELELRCFTNAHGISAAKLEVPRTRVISLEGHRLLASGALTYDELGLLETVVPVGKKLLEKQAKVLDNFSPQLTLKALKEISEVPSSFRGFVRFCGMALHEYEAVIIPDLRVGDHVLWESACEELKTFHWPHDSCKIDDSRLEQELEQYGRSVVSLLERAIQRNDEYLLTVIMKVLRSYDLKRIAEFLAAVIRRTEAYHGELVHTMFLRELQHFPYYNLAYAIAEQYERQTEAQQKVLDRILANLIGASNIQSAEGPERSPWRMYLENLTRLADQPGQEYGDPVLPNKKALKRILEGKTCEYDDLGWNWKWKKLAESYLARAVPS